MNEKWREECSVLLLFFFPFCTTAAASISSQHCQSVIRHGTRFHIREKNICKAGHAFVFPYLWAFVIQSSFCVYVF